MEEKYFVKKGLFSFDTLNKYYLIPFLAPIFCCTTNIFLKATYNKYNDEMELMIFFTISSEMIYLCGGFLYFISFIRTKTEETRNNAIEDKKQVISNVKYIYNDGSKKSKLKTLLLLTFISFLLALTRIFALLKKERTTFDNRLYYLFFISILSKYILKNKIYKHQKLSLFIASIGLIILFIPILLEIEKRDILYNIIGVFSSIAYSLFLVIIKYLTHYYYMSPLLCILLVGIISIILSFLLFILFSFIKYKDLSFITDNLDFLNKIDNKFLIYFLFGLFFGSILQILTVYVIYYFSPILLTVTDSISPMLSWIIDLIRNEPMKNPYINISFNGTGYLIQLIAGLIYNEIIICNFCGLNEYTKKNLQERENQELISILTITDNNEINEKENNNIVDNDSSSISDNKN